MPTPIRPPMPVFLKNWLYGFAVAGLIAGSTALIILLGVWVGQGLPLPQVSLPTASLPSLVSVPFELDKTKQWINCADVRQVIEEGDRLYLACGSGMLVANQAGTVVDQFSMADGLKNNFANSLVKKGNNLYVGHQDGFSIINLTDRSIKNISVGEGLINGANILLADDGDYLWIGTFDGVARYHIPTGTITNYHEELRAIGSKLSTSKVVVTANGVYFTFSAHAQSNGGLARFDKATNTFEVIPHDRFGSDKARLDLNEIIPYDGVVLVTDWSDFWIGEDKPNTNWTRYAGVQEQIKALAGISDYPSVKVLGFKDGKPLIFSHNLLFAYNLETRNLEVIYPANWQSEAPNALLMAQPLGQSKNLLWFNRPPGLNLVRFDSNTLTARTIALIDRPAEFNHFLGVINEQPVFVANNMQIWQLGARGFEKLMTSQVGTGGPDHIPGGYAFVPITGTSKVLVYFQSCGQGCSKPEVTLFDYLERSLKPIEVDPAILQQLGGADQGAFGYTSMNYQSFSENEATFQLPFTATPQIATVDYLTGQWQLRPAAAAEIDDKAPTMRCNPVYSLTSGKFDPAKCELETQQYRFEVVNAGGRSGLNLVDKTINQITALVPTLAPKRYTPFAQPPDFYIPSYSFGIIAENKFWLATNLGLPAYDLNSATWQLFSTAQGLITNEIFSFAVTPKAIWAITENGGLAGIKR